MYVSSEMPQYFVHMGTTTNTENMRHSGYETGKMQLKKSLYQLMDPFATSLAILAMPTHTWCFLHVTW